MLEGREITRGPHNKIASQPTYPIENFKYSYTHEPAYLSHEHMLESDYNCLAGLGVYQEGIAKQRINDDNVTAHIYEYTIQLGMDLKVEIVQLKPKSVCPVQMLFCPHEATRGTMTIFTSYTVIMREGEIGRSVG